MAPDCLNSLKNVNLAVLYDLLDASVGCAVDSAPAAPVLGDDGHGSIVVPLAPTLHHVHQLDETVGRGWHLLGHWPAGQLEYLDRLWRCLHARHQLRQRDYFLVYPEHLDLKIYSLCVESL